MIDAPPVPGVAKTREEITDDDWRVGRRDPRRSHARGPVGRAKECSRAPSTISVGLMSTSVRPSLACSSGHSAILDRIP